MCTDWVVSSSRKSDYPIESHLERLAFVLRIAFTADDLQASRNMTASRWTIRLGDNDWCATDTQLYFGISHRGIVASLDGSSFALEQHFIYSSLDGYLIPSGS
jgi:hypothetical protein